jgi:hypothetical protein
MVGAYDYHFCRSYVSYESGPPMAITSLNNKNLIKLEGTNGYHFWKRQGILQILALCDDANGWITRIWSNWRVQMDITFEKDRGFYKS